MPYLAIFVASLGLFGLTSFTVEQRTKEIGVRKAMGSSVPGIYIVISREIIILVSISALIAWPLIYYIAGNGWRTSITGLNPGVFSLCSGLSDCSWYSSSDNQLQNNESWQKVNPAQSLKYE